MAMRMHYDGLSEISVTIESQEIQDDKPVGLPYRRIFVNLPDSREELAGYVPAELLAEILEVWGDTPLEALPGAEIAGDAAPDMEEQLAALVLTQAQQDATIAQLQQANAALMLQLAQTQVGGGGMDA